MVESRGVEPLSKLRSILKITYTIANYRWLAHTRDDQSVIYHHHLLLLAVSKKSARAKDSMNLKYLPLGGILFWREAESSSH